MKEQRQRFIELMAYWEGKLNAVTLIKQFSISRQQASNDIKAYQAIAPTNLLYNGSSKAFHATENFKPIFINLIVDEYLAWLQSPTEFISATHCLNETPSHCYSLALPARHVSAEVIRGLVTALKQQRRIEVDYISLNNPNNAGRIIVPHHFVNTGTRWHLRAWCEKSKDYRDFVLSRFCGVPELLDKSPYSVQQDTAWNTEVAIVLTPDPRLSKEKQFVIANDYQMEKGQLIIKTKGCLVNYFIREMQISTKMLDVTPEAQQLICVNLVDIKQWLFEG